MGKGTGTRTTYLKTYNAKPLTEHFVHLVIKIIPVNGSTDVHIPGSAVDHKVVVMLAPGSDGVLDVVERGIIPVLGPNCEEWGSRQVYIFHDFHCVR